jgi:predicted ribosome quality control (RQC) complex YloA/Tae2 family protein
MISEIAQIGTERIVCITLHGKEDSLIIYLELFGKGNFVLCEEDNTIIGCLEKGIFGDRVIKPGATYEVPERDVLLEQLSEKEFNEIINNSDSDNISTTLAVKFSMGGLLAKELCSLAGVQQSQKMTSVAEREKMFVAWQNLMKRKVQPILILKNEKPHEVIPFPMKIFENEQQVPLESISQGIDQIFQKQFQEKTPTKETKSKQVKRLERAMKIQSQKAKELEERAQQNQEKGEYIYEHYQEIKKILDEISELMKTESLQQIQEKISGKGVIKELNPEKGNITIELE